MHDTSVSQIQLRDSRVQPASPRAREIAAMVALGLSNREIAAKLQVSVRTVEGHIYRACINSTFLIVTTSPPSCQAAFSPRPAKKGLTRRAGHARVSAQTTWVTSGR